MGKMMEVEEVMVAGGGGGGGGGIRIPRRKRSSPAEDGGSISMLEAAKILVAMANGGLCRDDEMGRKRERKRRRKEVEIPPSGRSSPEMPAAMRDRIVEMGGYEIQMVIQKQLQDTDMNRNQGRLCLPGKKVREDFVTEEERKALEEDEDDDNNSDNKDKNKKKKKKKKKKKGMEVMIMNDVLQESSIWLKKWKIGSGNVYCLMTHWNSFVQQTKLKTGDFIQLWSFRVNTHRLCFAIVKLSHFSHSL